MYDDDDDIELFSVYFYCVKIDFSFISLVCLLSTKHFLFNFQHFIITHHHHHHHHWFWYQQTVISHLWNMTCFFHVNDWCTENNKKLFWDIVAQSASTNQPINGVYQFHFFFFLNLTFFLPNFFSRTFFLWLTIWIYSWVGWNS